MFIFLDYQIRRTLHNYSLCSLLSISGIRSVNRGHIYGGITRVSESQENVWHDSDNKTERFITEPLQIWLEIYCC